MNGCEPWEVTESSVKNPFTYSKQWIAKWHCLIAPLLLPGCATTFMVHPEIAREAEARFPVDPARNGDRAEAVVVTNKSGYRLTGWVFSNPTNHGVLLVGDGNATGLAHTYHYNRYLLGHGFNMVVLSYQGFDSNEGRATLGSLSGDIEAFYQACRARFPGQPVALVGESLSAGAFFCFGSRHPDIACSVLEGTVDLKRVAFETLNGSWVLQVLYPVTFPFACMVSATVPGELSAARALGRHPAIPVLFIHHPQDPVTPYDRARRLFEEYEGPKEFVCPQVDEMKGFHMTGVFDPDVRGRILDFLANHLNAGRNGKAGTTAYPARISKN